MKRPLLLTAAVAFVGVLLLTSCKPLTDLETVEQKGSWRKSGITMNATNYPQAWVYRPSAAGCSNAYVDFNIGKAWKGFEATVGTSDDTNSSRRYDYRVLVDGVQRATGTVQLGTTKKVSVSVTNALRLRLEIMPRCGTGSGNKGQIAYASPLLTK